MFVCPGCPGCLWGCPGCIVCLSGQSGLLSGLSGLSGLWGSEVTPFGGSEATPLPPEAVSENPYWQNLSPKVSRF